MSVSFPPSGFPGGAGSTSASRGNSPRSGVSRPGSGATVSLALDNMLRNQLKVSNPRDPKQVAEGLLAYYQDLPQTAGIRQEALGLPFLQTPTMPAPPPPQPTSSDAEFNIANGDVEKALQDLASNPLTNDITPEMQGWGDSIRGAIVQGHAAARRGLDPTQRDMVISVRRQLGEYGRMARFVGSLSPGMNPNFRRLGQGMDEMSAVLLVMLGESLASVGFAAGYYLLQVPLAEVQQRRDAVIFALRNFMGGAQEAYGPDDWPRGIDAYRRLYKWLEEQGQGDLRSLLLENEIAQAMDALIARAQNGTPEGLRALGVTAQLDIERYRRMAIVAPGAMMRADGFIDRSPPLESYLQALELFAETFTPAGGLRLLRIARPPILFYGIYNPNLLEDDRELVELIMVRGNLATIFDGLFSDSRDVVPQVLLDMLLLELDRGIDLLSLGANPKEKGPTERRALAYWLIVRVIQNLLGLPGKQGLYANAAVFIDNAASGLGESNPFVDFTPSGAGASATYSVTLATSVTSNLMSASNGVNPFSLTATTSFSLTGATPVQVYLVPERSAAPSDNTAWGGLYPVTINGPTATIENIPARNIRPPPGQLIAGTTRFAPTAGNWGGNVTLIYVSQPVLQGPIADLIAKEADPANHETGFLQQELTRIQKTYASATTGTPGLQRAFGQYNQLRATQVPTYLDLAHFNPVAEELRVQESLEERWQNLVRTVAPEAGDQEWVFRLLKLVIKQAAYDAEQLAAVTRLPRAPTALPPQFEQSLEELLSTTRRRLTAG
jgi:hypothetical protein